MSFQIATLSLSKDADFQKTNIWLLGNLADWPSAVFGSLPSWLENEKSGKTSVYTQTQRGNLEIVVFLHNQPAEACRKAGAEALALAKKWQWTNGRLWSNVGNADLVMAFLEGFQLASYQFGKYQKAPGAAFERLAVSHPFLDKQNIKSLNIIADSVGLTRTLVNEPAGYLTAKKLSDAFEKTAKEAGFEVEVLGKNKIKTLKMGGLLGVNQGSDLEPTFNILSYKPKHAQNKKPIVLVGKGVVYDTGGHSLKTSAGMEWMKCDMAGSATVLGTIKAVAELGLPLHVIGLVPATDNRISAAALSPGDIITISDGTTVEVLNTDAEGRLILADALVFAQKFDPELVIDFATLTGAAARAIGKEGFVFMGTASTDIKNMLHRAGNQVYERGVEFPLWDEYADYLKSDIADLKNIGGAEAGAITAGKFLQHFTSYPWLHLDIAGTSFYEGGAVGYISKNGTGIGVRLMVEFLKGLL